MAIMEEKQETKNALWRREEQLRRWDVSETNRESAIPRQDRRPANVKFQDGCVFLAACSSGDTDEIVRLLGNGSDINTTNVDGLTALHQACIDDNFSMVKFLVEHGADIDACDNEGWTALHATASCGFVKIAKYLLDKGANIQAVNNDGELAIDLAEGKEMEALITNTMERLGMDADAARNEEEEVMLQHANQWLNSKCFNDKPHPKTGASALHIAASKGYIKVMKILLEAGADTEAKDFDGWTAMHAAAHWGQEEACKILVESFCNLDAKNVAGQTPLDVADPEIESLLEELKKKQALMIKDKEITNRNGDIIHGFSPGKRRSSVTRLSVDQKANLLIKNVEEERAQLEAMRSSTVEEKDEDRKSSEESDASKEESEASSTSESETDKQNEINSQPLQPQINGSSKSVESGVKNLEQIEENKIPPPKTPVLPSATIISRIQDLTVTEPVSQAKKELESVSRKVDSDKPLQSLWFNRDISKGTESKDRNISETGRTANVLPSTIKTAVNRAASAPTVTLPSTTSGPSKPTVAISRQTSILPTKSESPVPPNRLDNIPSSWRASLRKTGSSNAVNETGKYKLEATKIQRCVSNPWIGTNNDSQQKKPEEVDTKNRFSALYDRYTSLLLPGNGSSSATEVPKTPPPSKPAVVATTATTGTSIPLSTQILYSQMRRTRRQPDADADKQSVQTTAPTTVVTNSAPTCVASTTGLLSASTSDALAAIANTRRSYEMPKRDEEKEVERKARAKRARETRRSTQGISKEDLHMAEEALQASTASRTAASTEASEKSTKDSKVDDKPAIGLRQSWIAERKESDSSASPYRKSCDLTQSDVTTGITPGFVRNLRNSGQFSAIASTTGSNVVSSSFNPLASTMSGSNPDVSLTSSVPTPSYRSTYRSKYLLEKEEEAKRRAAEDEAKRKAAEDAQRLADEEAKKLLADDDKKEDKEDPSQKSAAIRARKKRDGRRSTGRINADDLQGISHDDKEGKDSNLDSTNVDKEPPSSAVSQTSQQCPVDRTAALPVSGRTSSYVSFPHSSSDSAKEPDYKKLYEDERLSNEDLKKEMSQLQKDLSNCRSELEKAKSSTFSSVYSRSTDSSTERRMTYTEKRALERKIAELEEELKISENSKADLRLDNQRLKDENGALIRVISKLSK